jgi:hypothetical protein
MPGWYGSYTVQSRTACTYQDFPLDEAWFETAGSGIHTEPNWVVDQPIPRAVMNPTPGRVQHSTPIDRKSHEAPMLAGRVVIATRPGLGLGLSLLRGPTPFGIWLSPEIAASPKAGWNGPIDPNA